MSWKLRDGSRDMAARMADGPLAVNGPQSLAREAVDIAGAMVAECCTPNTDGADEGDSRWPAVGRCAGRPRRGECAGPGNRAGLRSRSRDLADRGRRHPYLPVRHGSRA